jgi:glycosyltransferase involved in cell wall biosynthesis
LTVVVLTFNEESNLPACLASVAELGAQLVVVDSGSTDRTCEVARRHGAAVVQHPFTTHSAQWKWALDHVPIHTPWVLALDADQRVTAELLQELRDLDSPRFAGVAGAFVARRQVFRGRWIRHGGYYPKYLLKLFRRDRVRLSLDDLVDHHFVVDGATTKLNGDIIEANTKEDDIAFWIEKHNRYAALLAREELQWRRRGHRPSFGDLVSDDPDRRTSALKSVWRRMPLYVRPFAYFLHRYVLRLGFLDGKQGAIFHFLQAFWFRMLVDINIDDLRRQREPA